MLSVEVNAFLDLLLDGLLRLTIRWVESLVAAKRAASRADFTVTVGTTEACIDTNLLHPASELLREVVAVAVESAFVAPRVNHRILFLSQNQQNRQNHLSWSGKQPTGLLSGGNPVGCRRMFIIGVLHCFACFVI